MSQLVGPFRLVRLVRLVRPACLCRRVRFAGGGPGGLGVLMAVLWAVAVPAAPLRAQPSDDPARGQPWLEAGRLPVSLEKIRRELGLPKPIVESLARRPNFRIEVEARPPFDPFKRLDFSAGPVPAGGVYAYEIQRLIWNPVDHPLVQPYAAFSGREMAVITIENLLARIFARAFGSNLASALRSQDDEVARAEVARAVAADYCAGQPAGGAGIALCQTPR